MEITSDDVERLQHRLINRKEKLTPNMVALVCNCVGFQDQDYNQNAFELEEFVETMGEQVLEWIKDDQFSLDMLSYVLATYTRYQYVIKLPGGDNSFFNEAESAIMRQGQFL